MNITSRLRFTYRTIAPSRSARLFHVGRHYSHGWSASRGNSEAVAENTSETNAVVEELERPGFRRHDARPGRGEFPRLTHRATPISVPDFRATYRQPEPGRETIDLDEVTVYGRILSVRRHGSKLLFLTIVNEFERVQGMVSFRKLHNTPDLTLDMFKMFAGLVERGDHVAITGRPTHTDRGELTIEANCLPELVAPASEPIPEKIKDPMTRMQQRHVDMLVNQETADVLRLRSYITKYMRDYFHSKSFLEFQTPILGENAGGAVARPFTTTSTEFPAKELALRIAPELWLKRLVVGGVDKVFEIGPAFRNEGIDLTHNPEFTMCEFYSAYSNLSDLIKQTEELICGMAEHCQELISSKLTSLPPIDLNKFSQPFQQVEFIPGLEEALGFRLPKLTGEHVLPELLAVLAMAKVDVPGGPPSTLAKLLDRLAAIYLEPKSFDGPLFITHHPECMSPLAKSFLCPHTGQLVSARTELFINGRELANMYEEENDPAAQAQKLAAHRTPTGDGAAEDGVLDEQEAAPLDKSYIRAIEAGLPPTGGWGCGVERLVMLFSGATRISDCLSFGSLRNVVGLTSGMRDKEGKPASVDDAISSPR